MRGIILALLLTLAGSEKSQNVFTLKEIKSSRVNEPHVQLENLEGLKYRFGSEVYQMPLRLLKAKNIEAKELVEDSRVQKSPVLLKAAMLSYGTMVNKFCALQLLHDFAAEAANKVHTEEMTIPLKAIGNAGQVSSIKRLMKFLPGFSSSAHQLPVRVQVDAVMALKNIVSNDPKRVEENLHSSLKKRSTHTEVRLMPDAVLMEYRPSAAAMISMAEPIPKETKVNLQLSDFVYSYMKALNQSYSPIKP